MKPVVYYLHEKREEQNDGNEYVILRSVVNIVIIGARGSIRNVSLYHLHATTSSISQLIPSNLQLIPVPT